MCIFHDETEWCVWLIHKDDQILCKEQNDDDSVAARAVYQRNRLIHIIESKYLEFRYNKITKLVW